MMLWSLLFLLLFCSPDAQAERGYRLVQDRDFAGAREVLAAIERPTKLADYNRYAFNRAIIAHAMEDQDEALKYIGYLEASFQPVPKRYEAVASLMKEDMKTWRPKDEGAIARKMHAVADRLANARGGPETQKIQRDIVRRLDELIKEAENQAKGGPEGMGSERAKADGAENVPNQAMEDSKIAGEGGKGTATPLKRMTAAQWGSLPPREQARAIQEMTQGMSPRHREAIENYFRNLTKTMK